MKLNGKKYLFSKGIAFYPEQEMETLKSEAKKGWHFQKLNVLGLLVFKRGELEDKQFSVDFYTGKKEEVAEYLSIYNEAGWQCISNFKQKYFYFKADIDTPAIYSEAESYLARIKKEWQWLFLHSLWSIPFSVLFGAAAFFMKGIQTGNWVLSILHSILFLTMWILLIWPVAVGFSILFSYFVYRNRPDYYNCPQKFAKKQRFVRDLLLLALFGAVIGFFIGMCFPL